MGEAGPHPIPSYHPQLLPLQQSGGVHASSGRKVPLLYPPTLALRGTNAESILQDGQLWTPPERALLKCPRQSGGWQRDFSIQGELTGYRYHGFARILVPDGVI